MPQLQLSRRWVREFFRDSTQLGPVLLALVVGLAGGAGAILFRSLIQLSHQLFFSGSEWLVGGPADYRVIALPVLGLLTVTAIVRRWAAEARGHGVPEVQYAVRRRGGRIRARVAAVKALASAICIGSGGSVGREGPIVQIGSSLGSSLGRFLGLREDSVKLLLACGAAAGIGGTFNAPIAGVLFAMEVILGSFTGRSFGLLVLSSVAATALVQSILGSEPAFALREVFALVSPLELPFYLVLGIVAGGLSVTYVKAFYAFERLFDRWKVSPYLKAATGGLVVGLIGYVGIRFLGGAHLFGVGYEGVEKALALGGHSGEMTIAVLVILVALKIISTSTTLAAGGSGGVFAPALYIGAMAGGAFGLAVHAAFPTVTAEAGAYALVGMGALFAGAAHAPISSVLILFEMTDDYQIILPLMLAVVVSHLIAVRLSADSIYSVKLRHLGGMSPLQAARRSVLDLVLVTDAMSPATEAVGSDTPVTDLAVRFRDRGARSFPVVDDAGSLLGLDCGGRDDYRPAHVQTRRDAARGAAAHQRPRGRPGSRGRSAGSGAADRTAGAGADPVGGGRDGERARHAARPPGHGPAFRGRLGRGAARGQPGAPRPVLQAPAGARAPRAVPGDQPAPRRPRHRSQRRDRHRARRPAGDRDDARQRVASARVGRRPAPAVSGRGPPGPARPREGA
jgi:CIC family chloride channel protein